MEIATLIISVLTLLTTIAGIVVSVVLYKKQKKDIALAEKKRKEEERQNAKDELDAMGITESGFSLYGYSKIEIARVKLLKKRLGKR